MLKRDIFRSRATQWLGTALLGLLVSGEAAAYKPAPSREAPQVDPCECGPLDVVFAVDTTGSMGSSLANFQAAYPSLHSQIVASSNGDYHLGLVTFKDNVTVDVNLGYGPAVDPAMSAAIGALTATGGNNGPEASDEALNTVINNLNGFTGMWRTGSRRVVVLITDNLPGGYDDNHTAVDVTNAHNRAVDAYNKGIKIHAIYIPPRAVDPAVVTIMQDYATTSRGLYRETMPGGADIGQAVQDFMSDCRTPSDVFIKDEPADVGNEPGSPSSIWYSPDIKVCNNPGGCAAPGTNPVYGSTNNYVFVTLRNYGPNRPSGPIGGSLHVYYLPSGGNSSWPGSWQLIKVEHGIYLTAGETREVRIKWDNVPVPGHYCLLARWVSNGDPMTFPETFGSSTVTNTERNNNIAWRNVDIVRATLGGSAGTTYDVRPLPGRPMVLAVRPVEGPFPGRITLDLGARIFDIWKARGAEGDGIEGIDGTTLYFGREGGTVRLATDERGLDERMHLGFHSDGTKAGTFPVHVFEIDEKDGRDIGGVRYEVNFLEHTAQPFPVDLGAVRTRDGLVELAWPHAVHHKAYRVYRSDKPEAGTGAVIAEFAAGEARETEAVRFVDPESKGRGFFYSVESISSGGKALSEPVSAGPFRN